MDQARRPNPQKIAENLDLSSKATVGFAEVSPSTPRPTPKSGETNARPSKRHKNASLKRRTSVSNHSLKRRRYGGEVKTRDIQKIHPAQYHQKTPVTDTAVAPARTREIDYWLRKRNSPTMRDQQWVGCTCQGLSTPPCDRLRPTTERDQQRVGCTHRAAHQAGADEERRKITDNPQFKLIPKVRVELPA